MAWWDDLNSGMPTGPRPGSIEALRAQMSAQPKPQPKKKEKDFWTDQLSTAGGIIGGIGGGLLGAVGGPAGIAAGAAAGGAAGSGLGEGLENALMGEDLLKNVGQEALLGGIFAPPPVRAAKGLFSAGKTLVQGGGKNAAKLSLEKALTQPSLMKRAATGIGSNVQNKATSNFLKLTPQQTARLLDEGVDPTNLAKRAAQFGNSAEEIIGATGKGGPLQASIKALESGIEQIAKTAGKNVRIPGDELVKALKSHARTIKSELGGGARLQSINQIITDAERKYAKGVTVQQARNILKEANQKFGASVLDDTGDAVARAAQKLEGNTMREALKSRFPGIATALDDEAELIQVREILSRVRGINKANKGGFGKFDLTRPGTLVDPAVKSDMFTSRMLRRGSTGKTPDVQGNFKIGLGGITAREFGQANLIPRGDQQSLEDSLMSSYSPEFGNTSPSTTDTMSPMTNIMANTSNIGSLYQNSSEMSSPYPRENLMADIARDPVNAAKYIEQYQMFQEVFAPQSAPELTSGQLTRAAAAQNALNDVPLIQEAISSGKLGGLKALPFSDTPIARRVLGTENLDAALFNMADNILRARTGAAAPEAEVRRFVQTFLPSAIDSDEAKIAKLQRTIRELQGYVNPRQAANPSLEDAIMNFTGGGGY